MNNLKNKVILMAVVSVLLGLFCGRAEAFVMAFEPSPKSLGDLAHANYYEWWFEIPALKGEQISEAVLTINNISDWRDESDNLYIHLLDSKKSGGTKIGSNSYPIYGPNTRTKTFRWNDGEGGGDNWSTWGPQIANWSDPDGDGLATYDLIYRFSTLNLTDDLTNYLSDGKFGIGFDPDCHYFNDGVKMEITYGAVPEPATMSLLGLGLLGLAGLRKKKLS